MQVHKIIVSDRYAFIAILLIIAEHFNVDFAVQYAPTGMVIEFASPHITDSDFVDLAYNDPDIDEDFLIFYIDGSSLHLSEI